jgi:hypothetical protein
LRLRLTALEDLASALARLRLRLKVLEDLASALAQLRLLRTHSVVPATHTARSTPNELSGSWDHLLFVTDDDGVHL